MQNAECSAYHKYSRNTIITLTLSYLFLPLFLTWFFLLGALPSSIPTQVVYSHKAPPTFYYLRISSQHAQWWQKVLGGIMGPLSSAGQEH